MSVREFQDMRAMVTGSPGGIGRVVSLRLAELGCTLGLFGRSSAKLTDLASRSTALGATVSTYSGDLRDRAFVERSVDDFVERAGRIDLVVHCAGIGVRGVFDRIGIDDEWEVIDTNFRSSVGLLKILIPHLVRNDWAHFVNLSALGCHYWAPYQAAYVSSKAGFLAYCSSLAYELSPHDVFISNVIFSGVDTEFLENVGFETYRGRDSLLDPNTVAEAVVKIVRAPRHYVFVGPWLSSLVARLSVFSPRVFQRFIEARNAPPE